MEMTVIHKGVSAGQTPVRAPHGDQSDEPASFGTTRLALRVLAEVRTGTMTSETAITLALGDLPATVRDFPTPIP
jgi:hypothetical protein